MSDMDWADEIAGKFEPMHVGIGGFRKEIAAALRKAKADGMREAADMIEACGQCDCVDHVDEIREAAKILSPAA